MILNKKEIKEIAFKIWCYYEHEYYVDTSSWKNSEPMEPPLEERKKINKKARDDFDKTVLKTVELLTDKEKREVKSSIIELFEILWCPKSQDVNCEDISDETEHKIKFINIYNTVALNLSKEAVEDDYECDWMVEKLINILYDRFNERPFSYEKEVVEIKNKKYIKINWLEGRDLPAIDKMIGRLYNFSICPACEENQFEESQELCHSCNYGG